MEERIKQTLLHQLTSCFEKFVFFLLFRKETKEFVRNPNPAHEEHVTKVQERT